MIQFTCTHFFEYQGMSAQQWLNSNAIAHNDLPMDTWSIKQRTTVNTASEDMDELQFQHAIQEMLQFASANRFIKSFSRSFQGLFVHFRLDD